jgi:hypothetical protein
MLPFRSVACTVVAKPELALARVVASSFTAQHPEIPFVVALTDRVDGCFDPAAEPFELLEVASLPFAGNADLRFRYHRHQLSYAATPFVLEHLLERGFERVLFFKQESLVLGSHAEAIALLDHHAILLTPHLLEPLTGAGAVQRELDVLLAGSYNLGFLALADGAPARAFLAWWQERLRDHSIHAVAQGMHWEQRWIDLVPGMFDGVHVLRDPAANIGHWSLPERKIALDDDTLLVDGRPCRLFRFSGYDIDRPDRVTRHSDRLRTDVSGAVDAAFARYRAALAAAEHDVARAWPYAYEQFDNGVVVPDAVRRLHAELGDGARRFGDPFATAGPDSFWGWLTAGDDALPAITRLWAWLLRQRPDVQAAYPKPGTDDRNGFAGWAATTGHLEHAIPDGFPVLAG